MHQHPLHANRAPRNGLSILAPDLHGPVLHFSLIHLAHGDVNRGCRPGTMPFLQGGFLT